MSKQKKHLEVNGKFCSPIESYLTHVKLKNTYVCAWGWWVCVYLYVNASVVMSVRKILLDFTHNFNRCKRCFENFRYYLQMSAIRDSEKFSINFILPFYSLTLWNFPHFLQVFFFFFWEQGGRVLFSRAGSILFLRSRF